LTRNVRRGKSQPEEARLEVAGGSFGDDFTAPIRSKAIQHDAIEAGDSCDLAHTFAIKDVERFWYAQSRDDGTQVLTASNGVARGRLPVTEGLPLEDRDVADTVADALE